MSRKSLGKLSLAVSSVLLVVIVVVLFRPVSAAPFASTPRPLESFEAAVLRVEQLHAADSSEILPICRARLMSHGVKTERVVVLIHGYTSCPEQFAQLGREFFGAGDNVLILPLPLHGYPDRMTEAHALLEARELTAYGDAAIDIGSALGSKVIVAGLSTGGLIAGWIAQNRADVELAVLISPVFGYAVVPSALTLPAMRIYSLLPDRFVWWDELQRESLGPEYSYPRYSRKALVQLLRLAGAVRTQARSAGPRAKRILVVTNSGDDMVSRPRIDDMVNLWQRAGTAEVQTFDFPREAGLGHDLIDPTLIGEKSDLVYSRLLELMR